MTGRMSGKVVVITGTGGAMGRAAALRFTAEGATVVGCDLDAESAARTEHEVHRAGGSFRSLAPSDLADEQQVERLMAATDELGGIDVLYNNAGAVRPGGPLELSRQDYEWTLATTLTQYWLCAKHAAPRMGGRGGGAIVNISSIAGGHVGTGLAGNQPQVFAYGLAKAGINRLTELLAIELAPLGIRVNTIAPGVVENAGNRELIGPEGSPARQAYLDTFLIKRIGRPDDVVNAALFLTCDESAYITGAHLTVDGGWTVSGQRGWPAVSEAGGAS
ncbi:SDR family NAD(P)-dependent oxidoreductase [Nonomuraea sp. NPDC050540]|uniref:SDR family NAD(P)-dependent oxidoreductase n=1 Tax=Nonomuraea sp. NPDC050540 TaxID=3364367 RepID=UPI0037BA418B